jgi:hypothetical protein
VDHQVQQLLDFGLEAHRLLFGYDHGFPRKRVWIVCFAMVHVSSKPLGFAQDK